MRKQRTLDTDYFEDLYREKPDPWDFATSDYEAAKYQRTLAALGETRAKRALEVGCSIGVLTLQLADVCDELISTDVSPTALAEARRRCADRQNIEFRLVKATDAGLDGLFDLIVLSEVVYYWDDQDLRARARDVADHIESGGRILLVHWLGETDYPKSADDAVSSLAIELAGRYFVERMERTAKYRLDLWRWRG